MSTPPEPQLGFLLTRHWRDADAGVEVDFWLATDEGARRVRLAPHEAVAFIPEAQHEMAEKVMQGEHGWALRPLALTDFQHRPVLGLYCLGYRKLLKLEKRLRQHGVDVYEADVRPPERYLMERFITAPVEHTGVPDASDPDLLLNGQLKPAEGNGIINEVRGLNRVVYDISGKPPATIECQ